MFRYPQMIYLATDINTIRRRALLILLFPFLLLESIAWNSRFSAELPIPNWVSFIYWGVMEDLKHAWKGLEDV